MNTTLRRLTAIAVVALGALLPAAAAHANPYAKGPDPSVSTVQNVGPYTYTRTGLPAGTSGGFASGAIWVPNGPAGETYGAIAVSPGFTENESAIQWVGPRLASHGFVVITLNTRTIFDDPRARGLQMLGALTWLTNTSPYRSKVDASRLAVAGHSMGGGGTLEASLRKPDLKAAIAFTPWSTGTGYGNIKVPTLIVAADQDVIAPINYHALPFYRRIPATTPKAYLQLRNADHFVTNRANLPVAVSTVTWAKRFIDNDTRYSQFLTPRPQGFGSSAYNGYATNSPAAWN